MGKPPAFELHQNYPNPSNPQTTIQYDLLKSCRVILVIFNIVGQQIRLLLNSQSQDPGFMQVIWDGWDEQGKAISSGTYLYRVTAFGKKAGKNNANILFQQTKKCY